MKTITALAIAVAMSLAAAPTAFAYDEHCEERGDTKTARGSIATTANDANVTYCPGEG
ncbi:MAG: hypothetical protein GXP01_07635 [Alphaproteobacteria bacterium]|nr:hypothetical protein [Alphaproteobacteria bacterium]